NKSSWTADSSVDLRWTAALTCDLTEEWFVLVRVEFKCGQRTMFKMFAEAFAFRLQHLSDLSLLEEIKLKLSLMESLK
uniref:hypothetical protein n=1 Tax=Salmonella sp. s57029 TaxID=3159692 RepID=UPI003A85A469